MPLTGLLELIHTILGWHVSMKSINQKQRGFTIVEAMVAIVIMGVLIAMVAPSFRMLTADSAVRSCTMDLVAALNTARADAVNLRRTVSVEAVDGTTTGNEWGAGGWTLEYAGSTESKTFDPCENATLAEADGTTTVTFDLQGRTPAALTFQVCHAKGEVTGRQIEVGRTGLLKNEDFDGCS